MPPSIRAALRAAGLACLILASGCFAATAVPARPTGFATVSASFNRFLDRTFGGLFRRHGTHRAPLGEGPVSIRADGGMQLDVHKRTLLGTTTTSGASANVVAERRTDRASLSVQGPLTYASGRSGIGQILANYATPEYGLAYGQLAGPSDSQLGIAGFARGLDLALPQRRGTLDFLGASGTSSDGIGYHAFGVRRSFAWGRTGQVAATVLHSAGEQNGEGATVVDLGIARTSRATTAIFELGYAASRHVPGTSDVGRLAWAGRIDRGDTKGFVSLSARAVPSQFVTIGGVQSGDRDASLTARRTVFGAGLLTADVAHVIATQNGIDTVTNRQTYEFSEPFKFGSVTLVGERAVISSLGTRSTTASLGVTATQTLRGTSITETLQRGSTNTDGQVAVTGQSALSITRNALGGAITLFGAVSHAAQSDGGTSLSDVLASYTRRIGQKSDLVAMMASQRSVLNGIPTRTQTTTLAINRRLSPLVNVRVDVNHTRQTGISGGTNNSIGFTLTGPFTLGGPSYGGRANPNVPATILGHVLLTDSDLQYGGARNRGAAGALVVLDGARTQRTDAMGGFAFRLVTPGTHTISVEPATLGPGIVVDRVSRELRVLGGQVVNVDFFAGPFAGIGGRVFVASGSGPKPLAGVTILVDRDVSTQTGPDGRYGIGRLAPGPHTVAVQTATLPATVQLTGVAQKTVSVVQGNVTTVDWNAVGLGAIGGHVLYAPDAGMGELTGAKDVYVVAQPGDHASITNPDGSFLIADLPPGTYTLSVDPDTLPDDQAVQQGPESPFTIAGGETVGGVAFKVGPKAKEVVFSFDGGKKVPLGIRVVPERVPPGGYVRIEARPQGAAGRGTVKAESDVFPSLTLRFDEKAKAYVGGFSVPFSLVSGKYDMRVALEGDRTGAAEASFDVDAKLPLVQVRTSPAHPQPGHTIHVVARILAAVEAGDKLTFQDGYAVTLPTPKGTLYAFDIRIWARGLPYRGTIATKAGRAIPFVIDGK